MLLNFRPLLIVGIALFALVLVFSIVTLPVEWDASSRAKHLMVSAGIVSYREQEDASKVLNAAFLTYLAAAVTAMLRGPFEDTLLNSRLLARRGEDPDFAVGKNPVNVEENEFNFAGASGSG